MQLLQALNLKEMYLKILQFFFGLFVDKQTVSFYSVVLNSFLKQKCKKVSLNSNQCYRKHFYGDSVYGSRKHPGVNIFSCE